MMSVLGTSKRAEIEKSIYLKRLESNTIRLALLHRERFPNDIRSWDK